MVWEYDPTPKPMRPQVWRHARPPLAGVVIAMAFAASVAPRSECASAIDLAMERDGRGFRKRVQILTVVAS